ncbi:MAG: hypothetical protein AB1295_01205 [Candidatus Micrarchaeota archaeon]
MTSQKSVVGLLLLIGMLSAAFNPADYLYPSETNVTVSYVNFTDSGHSYSIVKLNNVDTFLLEDLEVVTEQSQIEDILYTYYVKEHYPSDDELDELISLIKKFNDSRNDGYDFKNKEEYVCRNDVLLSNGKIIISGEKVICRDEASCEKNAMLLFSVYGEGLALGSIDAISEPLMDFTPSSLKMDEYLGNYMEKLSDLNEDNLADTLEYISDTSEELVPLSEKIESTIFRTPRLNDTDDKEECYLECWAICPSFDLDQDAAEDLHDLAEDLTQKVGPLGGYESAASDVFSRTAERLDYVKGEDQATYYTTTFRPLNISGTRAIADAEDAVRHVKNNSLSAKLDQLKSLHVTIPEDIGNRNFTTIEADMSEYGGLVAEVQSGADFLLSIYNSTLEEKNRANGMIFVLQSKDLDPVSVKSLHLVENKTEDLGIQFHDGLTLTQLEELKEKYGLVADEAEELLMTESETPATRVLLLFRGFARRINTGIAEVADQTDVISRSEIPENPMNLGLFSLAVFLSLSSMALLAFLFVLGNGRFPVPKTTHMLGAAFAVVLLMILLFSLFMYVFLGKTSTDASLPEFINDLNGRHSTSIMLDLRDASLSDADAMRACASELASSFEDKNKTWTMYTITPSTCTQTASDGYQGAMSADDCIGEVDASDSSFVLGYSPTNEEPRFSVIYTNRAEIKANTDYYESCPLVALFS